MFTRSDLPQKRDGALPMDSSMKWVMPYRLRNRTMASAKFESTESDGWREIGQSEECRRFWNAALHEDFAKARPGRVEA